VLKDITNEQKDPMETVFRRTASEHQRPDPSTRPVPVRRIIASRLPEPEGLAREAAMDRVRYMKAMHFIADVETYAEEHKIAPLLDMLEVFKAEFVAVGGGRPAPRGGGGGQVAALPHASG
jgi:hypothetical protein